MNCTIIIEICYMPILNCPPFFFAEYTNERTKNGIKNKNWFGFSAELDSAYQKLHVDRF